MRKAIASIVIIFLLVGVLTINCVAAQPSNRISIIVGFKDKPDEDLAQTYGGKIKYKHNLIPAISCELPSRVINALKRDPNVAYIEEDGVVETMGEVLPWGVDRVDAEYLHSYNEGTGVNISIIDTGIDYTHPDLDSNVAGGKSFVNYTTDYMDDHGHGTHVAGIIAAEDNEIGVVGIAPESNLYALKVLDDQGSGYISDIVAAIEWSINNSMQIISMSIGSNFNYESLRTVCDEAYEAGILVLAAGGNDAATWTVRFGFDTIDYPARYDSVIAVGATDNNDVRASWSSTGPELELVAPGVNINSTYLNSTYATFDGTSMACPHVTGVAALVFNSLVDPAYDSDGDGVWDAAEVRKILQDTAEDLGDLGRDSLYGYGLVDAASDVDTKPPEISSVASLNLSPSNVTITWVTDEPSDSVVNFGMTKHLENTISNTTMVLNHIITLTGLNPDVTYYYEVQSTDLIGNTANDDNGGLYYAFRDMTLPSRISNLSATAGAYPNIHLIWNAATDNVGVDYYNVFRSTKETINKTTDFLATVIGTTTSYTDSTGIAETTYHYAVCAADEAGNEANLSNIASAMLSESTMHVKNIDMSTVTINVWRWSLTRAVVVLTVVDADGNPVEGATITGHGSGLTSGVASGVTNATGQVIVRSRYVWSASGTFTFTVNNVEKTGWIYDPSANVETSDSTTV